MFNNSQYNATISQLSLGLLDTTTLTGAHLRMALLLFASSFSQFTVLGQTTEITVYPSPPHRHLRLHSWAGRWRCS